jgi:hypothetical protein
VDKKINMAKTFDLSRHHKENINHLVPSAPYTLRITEWKKFPVPVLVIKERREIIETRKQEHQVKLPMVPQETRKELAELGHICGEPLQRLQPVIKHIVSKVRDDADISLELNRFISKEGLRLRINLPLDEEAGAKLGLIARLHSRIKEMDRVELIARRIVRFSREEAAYWLSRTTSYGSQANNWAIAGMRVMLGGHAGTKEPANMLDSTRMQQPL